MKIRLTDVKSVIREIVSDRLMENDFLRNYKSLTPEDQARIQKEFRIKINFDDLIVDPENFKHKWNDPKEGSRESNLYYMVGFATKDVYSTLDNDYAIILVSLNYSDPFGPAQEYKALAYGPKELMKQYETSINAMIYIPYSNGMGEGTLRTKGYLSSTNLFAVTNTVYGTIYDIARNSHVATDFETRFTGRFRVLVLPTPQDVKHIGQQAIPLIKKNLEKFFNRDIGYRVDFRGDEFGYFHVQLYNKNTGFTQAKLDLTELVLHWKDVRKWKDD